MKTSHESTSITAAMVDALEDEARRSKRRPACWETGRCRAKRPKGAALDVARTICRRAERLAAGLAEAGVIQNPNILAYLNRLSDMLWLLARLLEARKGVVSSLQAKDDTRARWSRAW